MAESANSHSHIETSPLTGPSSLESAIDPQGLSTVHEVPRHAADSRGNGSFDTTLRSKSTPPGVSPDVSLESSVGHSHEEKQIEAAGRQLRHRDSAQAVRQTGQQPGLSPSLLQNGNGKPRDIRSHQMSTPNSPKKERKGGFRNTLRRMFGRKPTRDRTSVPNPAVYPRHDPHEFITSATDVKAKRAASMPAQSVLRTSGLSSHPPHQSTSSSAPTPDIPLPPKPERRPPERPARPRRASVPSLVLNRQETDSVEAAMTGLGLQDAQEPQTFDTQNIGFAVTNGSNPRRRSRSVGAFQDTEHRMSPIQWRRWRRRSDEIRYWRASSEMVSPGVKGPDSPVMAQRNENDNADEDEGDLGVHNSDFNFGLPRDAMQNQERIGLEERIVTLEIKLMDFEYAISKLQAGSVPLSRRHSYHAGMDERQPSIDSDLLSERHQALVESSPSVSQGTPPMISSQWVKDIIPKPRPTSVATTLKPGQSGASRKDSITRSTRSSLAGLTIDHYTALITLVRNEQSARQRLEQQVSILQGRLDAISIPQSSLPRDYSFSQHSHARSLSSSQRRQGFVDLRGGTRRRQRPRSSSYSTTETDTDDDAFHDVYVTPDVTPVDRQRGEYERGAFDRVAGVEEGMAF